MTTTPRQRLIILGAMILIFAALYPFSRFVEQRKPPCHAVLLKCREFGRYDARTLQRRGLYKDCIITALQTGKLGDYQFSPEELEPCRTNIRERFSE